MDELCFKIEQQHRPVEGSLMVWQMSDLMRLNLVTHDDLKGESAGQKCEDRSRGEYNSSLVCG